MAFFALLDLPSELRVCIVRHDALDARDVACLKKTCRALRAEARVRRLDVAWDRSSEWLARALREGACETLTGKVLARMLIDVAAADPRAVAALVTVHARLNFDPAGIQALLALLALPALRHLYMDDVPMSEFELDARVHPRFSAAVVGVDEIDAAWDGKHFSMVEFSVGDDVDYDQLAAACGRLKRAGTRVDCIVMPHHVVNLHGMFPPNIVAQIPPVPPVDLPAYARFVGALADLVEDDVDASSVKAPFRDIVIDAALSRGRVRTLGVTQGLDAACDLFARIARGQQRPLTRLSVSLSGKALTEADAQDLRSILDEGATLSLSAYRLGEDTFTAPQPLLVDNDAIASLELQIMTVPDMYMLLPPRACPRVKHVTLFASDCGSDIRALEWAALGRRLGEFGEMTHVTLIMFSARPTSMDAFVRELFRGAPALRCLKLVASSTTTCAREGVEVIVA